MQSLSENARQSSAVAEDFFDFTRDPVGATLADVAHPQSSLRRSPTKLDAIVNAASRAGFVLSFLFLVTAGLYGLSLAGHLGVKPDTIPQAIDNAAASAGLSIRSISFEGLKHTPEAEARAALENTAHKSAIFFDTSAARERLLSLGWVENAQVQLTLPDKLHAVVTEREPFARWSQTAGASISVIDRKGHILGAAQGRYDELPLLVGDGAPLEAALLIPQIKARKDIAPRFRAAHWVAGRYWEIEMDSGLRIKLRCDPGDEAMKRLVHLLGNPELSGPHIRALDLRLSGRIVVELKDQSIQSREKLVALLTRANEPIAPRGNVRRGGGAS
mgnify:CR=1 FL=1